MPDKAKTLYRYEVRGGCCTWSVLAVGPRGGVRWIGDYSSRETAQKVADVLTRYRRD